jgi:hypothetical protein
MDRCRTTMFPDPCRPGSRARAAALACVWVAVLLTTLVPGAAWGQGVVWQPLALDQALAEAQNTGHLILVYVWAAHCGQCEQMRIDLWDTPAGASLAEGTIPLKIDSTTPAGRELSQRYPILGLPTSLFLSPEGMEVDRVEGYENARSFLSEAEPLKSGVDPLPGLEAQLAAHPDSVPLMVPILERYLYRMRDQDAEAISKRLLELDPRNRTRQPEIALRTLANYFANIRGNMSRSHEYWTQLLDRYPECSSAGGAVDGLYKAALGVGRFEDWKTFMCGLVEKQSANGRLLYAIAMSARRHGVRGPCFAQAARRAGSLGVGGARMDTVAAELEKPAPTGR